jgi:hypothetical protein
MLSPTVVVRGLDPRTHLLLLRENGGLPDQARQRRRDGSIERITISRHS